MANLFRLSACLFLCVSLNSFGAYFVQLDGTIVNPITDRDGTPLNYSGNNLEPFADLSYADLYFADLTRANLTGASLLGASLNSADLDNADLSNANLIGADLTDATMDGLNLHGALYNEQTLFDSSYKDPVAEGMIFVSEVPLPAGIYLFLSGLVGLGLMRGKKK